MVQETISHTKFKAGEVVESGTTAAAGLVGYLKETGLWYKPVWTPKLEWIVTD